MEDVVIWVVLNLSGEAAALGAELKLKNWFLMFVCDSKELWVEVAGISDSPSSPPWEAYRDFMACRLVALGKRPGVRPVGIGKTLWRAITKLVLRAAGDQVKVACGNLQLCSSQEAGIKGDAHIVRMRREEKGGAQGYRG